LDRHRSRPAPRAPAGAQSTSVPFTLAGANLLFLLLRSLARLLATSPASAPACAVACPTASYLVICPTASYLTRFCCSSGSRSLPRSPAHVPHQKSAYTSKGSAKELSTRKTSNSICRPDPHFVLQLFGEHWGGQSRTKSSRRETHSTFLPRSTGLRSSSCRRPSSASQPLITHSPSSQNLA
jgi:hypothetical protein